MPVATKEQTAALTAKPEAFKVVQSGPKYHYLHRVVGPSALPDGTITGDMLDQEVEKWLKEGYRVEAVHYLGQHKGIDNNVHGYVYGYHLVKG